MRLGMLYIINGFINIFELFGGRAGSCCLQRNQRGIYSKSPLYDGEPKQDQAIERNFPYFLAGVIKHSSQKRSGIRSSMFPDNFNEICPNILVLLGDSVWLQYLRVQFLQRATSFKWPSILSQAFDILRAINSAEYSTGRPTPNKQPPVRPSRSQRAKASPLSHPYSRQ